MKGEPTSQLCNDFIYVCYLIMQVGIRWIPVKWALMTKEKRKNHSWKRDCKLHLRNRKHVPCFYRVIETRVEVWENEKCYGNTSRIEKRTTVFTVSNTLTIHLNFNCLYLEHHLLLISVYYLSFLNFVLNNF